MLVKPFVAFLVLVGTGIAASAGAEEASMLLYQVQEPGLEPYASRVIVTRQYLRMDDGGGEGDFVLFDRAKRNIFSVNHDDRTVFAIPARPVEIDPPMALERRAENIPANGGMPEVAGQKPKHHRLLVNGGECYNVVTVSGVLTDAVVALGEFREVLAGEHARILPHVPADMQLPCDLALNTFAPKWQLEYGLPIQEWDSSGKGQALLDFDPEFEAEESLFRLPGGYRHYGTGE